MFVIYHRLARVLFAANHPSHTLAHPMAQSKRKRLPHGRTGPSGEKKARHLELQERFLARPELQRGGEEVDPMLPGGKAGRWTDGLNIDGENAADTTASGQWVCRCHLRV